MLARTIHQVIRQTFVYNFIKSLWCHKELCHWEKRGKGGPAPHLFKQKLIKEYARKFSLEIFIETGTYLGDMVEAVRDTFSRIVSIEIDPWLSKQARKRFFRYPHISILQGDSGQLLPGLLASMTQPCLFWLDAHYSGGITARGGMETPVMQELRCIMSHPAEHVILIDDARNFTGQSDYPTLEVVQTLVRNTRPDYAFEVKDDIIRIHKTIGEPP
ncbi:MAG: hypothetical protein ACUVT8_13055 [Armatimonadota bacterium]